MTQRGLRGRDLFRMLRLVLLIGTACPGANLSGIKRRIGKRAYSRHASVMAQKDSTSSL
jgi:hypothetical protein